MWNEARVICMVHLLGGQPRFIPFVYSHHMVRPTHHSCLDVLYSVALSQPPCCAQSMTGDERLTIDPPRDRSASIVAGALMVGSPTRGICVEICLENGDGVGVERVVGGRVAAPRHCGPWACRDLRMEAFVGFAHHGAWAVQVTSS